MGVTTENREQALLPHLDAAYNTILIPVLFPSGAAFAQSRSASLGTEGDRRVYFRRASRWYVRSRKSHQDKHNRNAAER